MQRLTPEQAWAALKSGEELVDLCGAFPLTYRIKRNRLEYRKEDLETWHKSSVTIRQFFDICRWALPDSPETQDNSKYWDVRVREEAEPLKSPLERRLDRIEESIKAELQAANAAWPRLEKRVEELEKYAEHLRTSLPPEYGTTRDRVVRRVTNLETTCREHFQRIARLEEYKTAVDDLQKQMEKLGEQIQAICKHFDIVLL